MESSWRSSSCLIKFIIFLLFLSAAIDCAVSVATTTPQLLSSSSSDTRCSSTVQKPLSHDLDEEISKLKNKAEASSSSSSSSSSKKEIRRRLRNLGGPGSSPPRCYGKCGKCTPCRPVHVAVPPGTPVTAEYYPEAWRCKCGNKLYMP